MTSSTIKYAWAAAPWLLLGLHASGCSGPSIHRPSPTSPASVRAQEAPWPLIATSITRDPLDPSTLKASAATQGDGGHQHHQAAPPPQGDKTESKQPASNEGSGTMRGQAPGAGHVH
jgi:hypothetical protein